MQDRICAVTGATSGIGRAVVMGLAEMGATILMICRDRQKGEEVRAGIIAKTGNKNIDLLTADLSSQEDIRRLAEEVRGKYPRLDVLVNNAGGIFSPRRETVDGIEYTFALNHLAYFLLTNLLLNVIKENGHSRVVNVSSDAHMSGHINFDDLGYKKRYSAYRAYSQSKLANVLFTYELSRHVEVSGITVNALHPGVVRTNFGNTTANPLRVLVKIARPFMRSPEKGAETVLYLESSKNVEGVTGRYFYDKKEARSSKESYDLGAAKKLWQKSEELTESVPTGSA